MIQPIETAYKGYRFRSRLEARWAVFFDALGIRYEYEHEGFEGIWGEKYLPDFYLPDFNVYAEVKPNKERLLKDGRKIAACIDFEATELSHTGLLILGSIPFWERTKMVERGSDYCIGIPVFSYLYWRKGVVSDTACFFIGPTGHVHLFINNGYGWDCSTAPDFPKLAVGEDLWDIDVPVHNCKSVLIDPEAEELLKRAYVKARQARFEHGERPI